MKKKILIILGRYLPGYKGGGPGRSIANLVECLGDDYVFRVAAYDRDLGDEVQYKDVNISDWNKVGKAKVYYVPPRGYTFRLLLKLYKSSDIIYLCGCFNDYAIKTLILKRLSILKKPVVVAAMGLFSPMAFRIKYRKKKFFINICNAMGLFKNIKWSVTSNLEIGEIKQQVKTYDNFYIAQDIPRIVKREVYSKKKSIGNIKVTFLSRISRKKNLIFAIGILQEMPQNINIEFSIYGPIEEKKYWNECLNELNKLPKNIKWEYKGEVASKEVINVLRKEQIFLFPTLGENYGHVIQEALSAGCLCLLSDQTPWVDLSNYGVGYSIPLNRKDLFIQKLIEFAIMDDSKFQKKSEDAIEYSIIKSNVDNIADGYRKLFDTIL